jgi:hypothetical protein
MVVDRIADSGGCASSTAAHQSLLVYGEGSCYQLQVIFVLITISIILDDLIADILQFYGF